jgi:hypothetical protein
MKLRTRLTLVMLTLSLVPLGVTTAFIVRQSTAALTEEALSYRIATADVATEGSAQNGLTSLAVASLDAVVPSKQRARSRVVLGRDVVGGSGVAVESRGQPGAPRVVRGVFGLPGGPVGSLDCEAASITNPVRACESTELLPDPSSAVAGMRR